MKLELTENEINLLKLIMSGYSPNQSTFARKILAFLEQQEKCGGRVEESNEGDRSVKGNSFCNRCASRNNCIVNDCLTNGCLTNTFDDNSVPACFIEAAKDSTRKVVTLDAEAVIAKIAYIEHRLDRIERQVQK